MKKLLVGISLTVAMSAVAAPAFASYSLQYYNVNMPSFQNPVTTGPSVKTDTGSPGFISVYSVGSNYKANALMCSLGGLYCGGGTKVHDLSDFTTANLPNTYSAGCSCYLQLTTSSFTYVTVNSIGYWDSH